MGQSLKMSIIQSYMSFIDEGIEEYVYQVKINEIWGHCDKTAYSENPATDRWGQHRLSESRDL